MSIIIILSSAAAGAGFAALSAFLISRAREKTAFERGRSESAGQVCSLQEKEASLASQVLDLRSRLDASEGMLGREREKALEASTRAASLQNSADRVGQLEKELGLARGELSQKGSEVVRLETMLDKERIATEEKLALLNDARDKMKSEFQNLSALILEEKSAKFTEQNKSNLDALLSPVRDQLAEFKKRVEDVYDKESKDRVSLHVEISQLRELNQKISQDAVNLANALKGDNKTQGDWGELALVRVLEMSGLQKGREYETQVFSHSREGDAYKPDVVVYLPEDRHVVIDSKVSLVGYERYCSADAEEQRKEGLREHIASLKRHIGELSAKNYDQLPGLRTLDFVLLFVPVEAAFLTAIKEEKNLFSDAFAKNIILVCPSTLLVTLRTIANIWRNEYQTQNAQTIARKAAELYDKFVSFVDTLESVKSAIARASEECESAIKLLSRGKGNLVKRIEDFKSLGVKGKKDLSTRLIGAAEEDGGEVTPADE